MSRCTEFYRVFPASRVSLSTFFFVLLLSIILNELVSVGLTQKVTRYVISLGLIEPLYRVLPSFCSFDPLVLWLSIILYDLVWFWVSFENNYTLNLIKIHWYVSGFFLRDRSFIGIELNFEPLPSYPYQSLRKSWSVLSSSFGCIATQLHFFDCWVIQDGRYRKEPSFFQLYRVSLILPSWWG